MYITKKRRHEIQNQTIYSFDRYVELMVNSVIDTHCRKHMVNTFRLNIYYSLFVTKCHTPKYRVASRTALCENVLFFGFAAPTFFFFFYLSYLLL